MMLVTGLVFSEGEEGVFEGGAGDFEAVEGLVAEQHLADDGFGVLGW